MPIESVPQIGPLPILELLPVGEPAAPEKGAFSRELANFLPPPRAGTELSQHGRSGEQRTSHDRHHGASKTYQETKSPSKRSHSKVDETQDKQTKAQPPIDNRSDQTANESSTLQTGSRNSTQSLDEAEEENFESDEVAEETSSPVNENPIPLLAVIPIVVPIADNPTVSEEAASTSGASELKVLSEASSVGTVGPSSSSVGEVGNVGNVVANPSAPIDNFNAELVSNSEVVVAAIATPDSEHGEFAADEVGVSVDAQEVSAANQAEAVPAVNEALNSQDGQSGSSEGELLARTGEAESTEDGEANSKQSPDSQPVTGSQSTDGPTAQETQVSDQPAAAQPAADPSGGITSDSATTSSSSANLNPAALPGTTPVLSDPPLANNVSSADAPTGIASGQPTSPSRFHPSIKSNSSSSPTSSAPVEVDASRFVQRVSRAFVAAESRGGEVRLRLSPPELGSLHLQVTVDAGVLSARIETETSAARTILLENLPQLRERLAEQGMKIERFDVDVSGQNSGGNAGSPPGERDQREQGWRQEVPAARPARTQTRSIRSRDSTSDDDGLNVLV